MLIEYLSLGLAELKANKMRSILSLIGIMIGVMIVFIILSLGEALELAITQEILGEENVVRIRFVPEKDNELFGFLGELTSSVEGYYFSADDAVQIVENVEGVKSTYSEYTTSSSVAIEGKEAIVEVKRFYPEIHINSNYQVKEGKNLTAAINQEKAIIVSQDLCESFKTPNCSLLGKKIRIRNRIFEVVGTFESKSLTQSILMNESSYDMIFSSTTLNAILVKARDGFDASVVGKEVGQFLDQKYFKKNGNYLPEDMSLMIDTLTSMTEMLTVVMSAIAAISLLVAGIGVMNIMYVSVVERTKEIGVKRAMGASKKAIRDQFLIEASLLTLIGGLTGLCLGILLLNLVTGLIGVTMVPNPKYVLFSIMFSITLGFVCGYLPAKKAAKQNIITAISAD